MSDLIFGFLNSHKIQFGLVFGFFQQPLLSINDSNSVQLNSQRTSSVRKKYSPFFWKRYFPFGL